MDSVRGGGGVFDASGAATSPEEATVGEGAWGQRSTNIGVAIAAVKAVVGVWEVLFVPEQACRTLISQVSNNCDTV